MSENQRPPEADIIDPSAHAISVTKEPAKKPEKRAIVTIHLDSMSFLTGLGGLVAGALLALVVTWVTNTWDFMQQRAYGAIEKETEDAKRDLELANLELSELRVAKPLSARYRGNFEELRMIQVGPYPSDPLQIGKCEDGPCVRFSYWRKETEEGPRIVQAIIAPVLDFDPHESGVDLPKLSDRPPEDWPKQSFLPRDGECFGTWVLSGRYVISRLDSSSLHDIHVGVAIYPPGPDPNENRKLDECITRDEQLIRDAEHARPLERKGK